MRIKSQGRCAVSPRGIALLFVVMITPLASAGAGAFLSRIGDAIVVGGIGSLPPERKTCKAFAKCRYLQPKRVQSNIYYINGRCC